MVVRSPGWLLTLAVAALSGCPKTTPPRFPDAGVLDADYAPDGARESDAQTDDDGGVLDAGVLDAANDGGLVDGGVVVDDGLSHPAEAAVVTRAGAGGFLLRGIVIAPEGPISGEVLIVGDTITCVAANCAGEAMAATVTVIETNGVISAGLIDAHNHATYDFLGPWAPPDLFDNRYTWADDPTYEAHVAPEAAGGSSGTFVCPATKWAELRSIVHGTTTIMGQSPRQQCVNRLARNADHYHGLGDPTLITNIASIRSIADTQTSGTDRTDLIGGFGDGSITRYAIHLGEGVVGGAEFIDQEFASYVGREPRTGTRTYSIDLLHRGDGTPYGTATFIHAVALTRAELDEAIDGQAHFVWSPSSNMILYGQTADIDRLLERGAMVGMGPDWTVSGAREMLNEMRFARGWARASNVSRVTDAALVTMATTGSATAVGLDAHIGRLVPGMRADVTVFGRRSFDPYRAVVDSRSADVRLVFIDGAAYYGDMGLEAATAVNGDCEAFDACGAPKFLCAANTPGSTTRADETVEQIEMQLRTYTATYGITPLPLVDCSL
jgi:5-methylthioadenosine/S-adenosylhomocysteine deaminase